MQGRFSCAVALIVAALASLSGCAINITTQSFIAQDDTVAPLDLDGMQAKLSKELQNYRLDAVATRAIDGTQLRGLRFRTPNAQANVVFYGGNGMKIAESFTILKRFDKVPVNVIWFDYRGTGASDKHDTLHIEQIESDALTVFDYSRAHLDNDLPTIVHGLSMGSLVAGYVAERRDIDGLILDSAITTVPALVDNLTPFFASTTVSPELAEIDNLKMLQAYRGPLLIFAGDADKTTPRTFAETLRDASPSEPKTLVVIPGAKHGYCMKSDKAIAAYRSFVEQLQG